MSDKVYLNGGPIAYPQVSLELHQTTHREKRIVKQGKGDQVGEHQSRSLGRITV